MNYVKFLVCLLCLTFACISCKTTKKNNTYNDSKAFKIRGYHQHIFPDRKSMSFFKKRLDLLEKLDYNLVVFGMGHPGKSTITMHEDGRIETIGCSKEELANLVSYAINKGLEPVFEIKFVGKQLPMVEHLLQKHPELVIDKTNRLTVLNFNYQITPSTNACQLAILPQINFILSLYPKSHPAKYFLLGIDEFDADDMAVLAKSMNISPAQAFARSLEQGTEFLLNKGITPLIWGDILLSEKLGKPNAGITLPGFKVDPRMQYKHGSSYHGDFKSDKPYNLFQMVNYLKNKDKIIVVDWHYEPSTSGEFPSIDYFQSIGFKNVWGAPWFKDDNIRQFSKYASSRNCGGMVATTWHLAYLESQELAFQKMAYQSSTYFHDPDFIPPSKENFNYTLTDDKGKFLGNEEMTAFIPTSTKTITLKTQKPTNFYTDNHKLFISEIDNSSQESRVLNCLFLFLIQAKATHKNL